MGLKMGEMMKNKLIPDHALALSSHLSKEVSRTDLDLQQSIAYLRRQAPQVNLFSKTGWQTVSYLDYPLGWVNVLPNRVNNYLPLHMRIIKEL
jgi:NOL1/NOP2/fmu family ribosome biogenesis protein